jgi:hypothetical protein
MMSGKTRTLSDFSLMLKNFSLIAKYCPFCGHFKLSVVNEFNRRTGKKEYFYQCSTCGARGPILAFEPAEESEITFEQLHAVWNCRVTEKAVSELIDHITKHVRMTEELSALATESTVGRDKPPIPLYDVVYDWMKAHGYSLLCNPEYECECEREGYFMPCLDGEEMYKEFHSKVWGCEAWTSCLGEAPFPPPEPEE